MSTSDNDLGLSCPSKGKFYVCENAAIRFIGCCTIDPCADGSGNCPADNLEPTSFASDQYDNIPAQSCAAPTGSQGPNWYTCNSSQPFMGCCSVNACQNNGCPEGRLLAATLSNNPTNAQAIINAAPPSSTSSTTTSTSSATSTPSASSTPNSSDSSGESLPLGAIVGIAVGGTMFIAILLAFLAYRCGWLARNRKHQKEADEAMKHNSAYTQSEIWQDGIRSGTTSPGFPKPGFMPYSPEQYHQYHAQGPKSPPLSESWQVDSRHVSQMSELSGWDPVTSDKKQQPHTPLLAPGAMELDARHTELPVIAELPATTR